MPLLSYHILTCRKPIVFYYWKTERICIKAIEKAIERTHSWLNRFRRILIRWEKKPETYLTMLHFAPALIVWRNTDLLR
jgi:transposase